jgi:hypothetical protein
VTLLSYAVTIQNSSAFRVNESCHFNRLDVVIRPTAVTFAGVFAVKEYRINRGVIAWLMLLYRKAQ